MNTVLTYLYSLPRFGSQQELSCLCFQHRSIRLEDQTCLPRTGGSLHKGNSPFAPCEARVNVFMAMMSHVEC